MTDQSMGALFNQRRAAAALKLQQDRQSGVVSSTKSDLLEGNARKPTFLEIQLEQEREFSAQQRQQYCSEAGIRRGGYEGDKNSSNLASGRLSDCGGGNKDFRSREVVGGKAFDGSVRGRDSNYDRSGGRAGGKSRDFYNGSSSNRRDDSFKDLKPRHAIIEQGKVSTLLDKFGFIYCANRPIELFFHYSEYQGYAENLNVGDEVEFNVGPASGTRGNRRANEEGGEEKLAAYSVKSLEAGTVVWEVDAEPFGTRRRGKVEQAVRPGERDRERGSSQAQEGTIQLLEDNSNADGSANIEGQSSDEPKNLETAVKFGLLDYDAKSRSFSRSGSSRFSSSANERLGRNDIVEFTLVTDCRTGQKYARNIALLHSERERLQAERERVLLESASVEQGVIVSLKDGFGFLRSNRRKEQVYFDFSDVILPVGDGGSNDNKDNFRFVEGQNMEFLVLNDERVGCNGVGGKPSAKQLKLMPKGSVVFQQTLANGVTGIVTLCPCPPSDLTVTGGGKNKRGGGGLLEGKDGKVRLDTPIKFTPTEDLSAEPIVLTDATLSAKDLPGGVFSANRDGSRMGIWVRDGDTLLFDIVRDVVDGTCRVAPTIHHLPTGEGDGTVEDVNNESDEEVRYSVRLVSPSLAGRAEGVVNSVKDNYGFIRCAHRNVDSFFRLYDVLPIDIQEDMFRYQSSGDRCEKRGKLVTEHIYRPITVGTEVSFDLSLRSKQEGNTIGNRGHSSKQQNDREDLKAQRVAILPSSSVRVTQMLASNVTGTVLKVDPSQTLAGQIELETGVKTLTSEQRHPLTVKLLESIFKKKDNSSIVFHDVQSEKENEVMQDMVEATEGLELNYISVANGDFGRLHPGRIRISRVSYAPIDESKDSAKPFHDEDPGTQNRSVPSYDTSSASGKTPALPPDVSLSNQGKSADEMTESSPASHLLKKKKARNKSKVVTTARFDRHSLSTDYKGALPETGDVVQFDVFQSRCTGAVTVANMTVIERKMLERGMVPVPDSDSNIAFRPGSKSTGVVVDIMPQQQFGFIALLDEGSKKRETIFFSMKHVLPSDTTNEAGNKKNFIVLKHDINTSFLIHKGDEVTFDIEIGKNGKPSATNIVVVPSTALSTSFKAGKYPCQGYVLMEPAHTSLSNTPSHATSFGSPNGKSLSAGGGRWTPCAKEERGKNNDASESTVKEEGCIFVTFDPVNQDAKNFKPHSKNKVASLSDIDPGESLADVPSTHERLLVGEHAVASSTVSGTIESMSVVSPKPVAVYGPYLTYNNTAVAGRGAGSSSGFHDGLNAGAPKRGDLVSFVKGKGGKARDICTLQRNAATLLRGTLSKVDVLLKSATLTADTDGGEKYKIAFSDVVSCDPTLLKNEEAVEGIVCDGKIVGVCRIADLYLESKVGRGTKERQRLNLTVKKELLELGGKIMAQSRTAKGPDGTHGFVSGWTERISKFTPS